MIKLHQSTILEFCTNMQFIEIIFQNPFNNELL